MLAYLEATQTAFLSAMLTAESPFFNPSLTGMGTLKSATNGL